jgi:AAA domain (dynein-related subfamily)
MRVEISLKALRAIQKDFYQFKHMVNFFEIGDCRVEMMELKKLISTFATFGKEDIFEIQVENEPHTHIIIEKGTFKGKLTTPHRDKQTINQKEHFLNFSQTQQTNNNMNTNLMTATELTAVALIKAIADSKAVNKAKTLSSMLRDKGVDVSVRGLREKGFNENHVWTRTEDAERYLKTLPEDVFMEICPVIDEYYDNVHYTAPAPTGPAPTAKAINTATPEDVEEAAERVKNNIIQMVKDLTPNNGDANMAEVKKMITEAEERSADNLFSAQLKTIEELTEQKLYIDNLYKIVEKHITTKETVYVTPNVPAGQKVDGLQHSQFKDLLEMTVGLRPVNLFPWITGGAGGGKTHSAKQISEVLNVKFRSLSVCAQTTAAALFGYQNAQGIYISTTFRDCYENGGLFCLDEIDNGNPNILAALNSALSNGHCSFPDGQVEMNKDFYLIATANTVGNGATKNYVGRNPIDGATRDRFEFIHWSYDADIELKVMAKNNKTVFDRVKKLRDMAEEKGLTCIISPRATAGISAMTAMGWSIEKAINSAITEKLTPQEKSALSL